MNNFGERLRMYRIAAGMSQSELARRLGLERSRVSHWERGTSRIDIEMLSPISEVLGVSVNDLLGFYTDYSLNPSEEKILKNYRTLDKPGKRILMDFSEFLIEYEAQSEKTADEENGEVTSVPVYDLPASAGTGSFLDGDSYELVDFPADAVPRGTNFAVRVSGDSMEPEFKDGSIAFVKQAKEIIPGEVGVFILNGEGFLKSRGFGYRLRSLNEKYKDIIIGPYDDCRIVGKVIGKY